jgi:hypothetical protein
MTDLSPAAAAITKAFDERYELLGPLEGNWQEVCLAAALRALADYQRPAWDGTGPACHWTPTPHTRQELRNIAAELETSTTEN